jgi:hypothetical protein
MFSAEVATVRCAEWLERTAGRGATRSMRGAGPIAVARSFPPTVSRWFSGGALLSAYAPPGDDRSAPVGSALSLVLCAAGRLWVERIAVES